ncbi:hypothetical protein KY290_010117 [Solanum tuberosum]|uniref:Thaumatin-like protein n=1 Tax=Solanum tuberosum TaxID=4113 RepID=A0ABQ7VZ13_SOLTU|nr:hypothetical protein KY289_010500 [Solanum tuberosum]KAH0772980.1 hypothetical protein KY290_010117 [Solanum tuberosum]
MPLMLPLLTLPIGAPTRSGPLPLLGEAEDSTRAKLETLIGRGKCETGDCNGLLECQGYGSPPNTLAEFALNQPNNLDFVDISLVDGFNIPMEFSPINGGCRNLLCNAPINDQCPNELRTPGGCNNPCTVFKTNEFCCTNGQGSCGPTDFSRFFKQRCPDAYSYPQDDPTSLFTCPAGTNYKVVFCP